MNNLFNSLSKSGQKIFEQTSKPAEVVFNKTLEPALRQPMIQILVSWLIVVSIVYSAEDLPIQIKTFIKHPASKFIITVSSLFILTQDFVAAFGVTIVLLVMYYSILYFFNEKFTLIWPETDTHPGCVKTTVKDLLDLFDGDSAKLKKTMFEAGVPLDLTLTDRYAPLIATYLINFGHKITDTCRAPN